LALYRNDLSLFDLHLDASISIYPNWLKKISAYHSLLASADAASNELERAEQELAVLSKKVLKGIAVKFDEDSDQYEMVGGTRLSDRKRSRRTPSTPALA
jgi:hypothetical protein